MMRERMTFQSLLETSIDTHVNHFRTPNVIKYRMDSSSIHLNSEGKNMPISPTGRPGLYDYMVVFLFSILLLIADTDLLPG